MAIDAKIRQESPSCFATAVCRPIGIAKKYMNEIQGPFALEDMKRRDMISSLERGLCVLTAFDPDSMEMTPADVARKTGLPRAATRRILLTLCKLGYAMTDGKHFRLTPKVLNLSHHYLANNPIREWIEPILRDVADQTKESCTLNIRDGDETVSIMCANATSFGAIQMSVGLRIPLHVSTPGRVILAFGPEEDALKYVSDLKHVKFTSNTITSKKLLLDEIENIRKVGYAIGRGEWEVGVFALSVPIFLREYSGAQVCLSLVGNAARLNDESVIQARLSVLQAAAQQISAVLPDTGALDFIRPESVKT